eukprot:COSAG01_NODE_559_length_15469_cov_11.071308_13_plen_508_part_00
MLLCSGPACQNACHTFCCQPPLKEVPEEDWFCAACAAISPTKKARANKPPDKKINRHVGRRVQLKLDGRAGTVIDTGYGCFRIQMDSGEVLKRRSNAFVSVAQSENLDTERCLTCGGNDSEDCLVLCDGLGCDKARHTFCCDPPLLEVPKENWYCSGRCRASIESSQRDGSPAEVSGSKGVKRSATKASSKKSRRDAAMKLVGERVRISGGKVGVVTSANYGFFAVKLDSGASVNVRGNVLVVIKSNSDGAEDELNCLTCGRSDADESLVLCDGYGCGNCRHTFCCDPPLAEVPLDKWYCGVCEASRGLKPQKPRPRNPENSSLEFHWKRNLKVIGKTVQLDDDRIGQVLSSGNGFYAILLDDGSLVKRRGASLREYAMDEAGGSSSESSDEDNADDEDNHLDEDALGGDVAIALRAATLIHGAANLVQDEVATCLVDHRDAILAMLQSGQLVQILEKGLAVTGPIIGGCHRADYTVPRAGKPPPYEDYAFLPPPPPSLSVSHHSIF